MKIVVGGNCQSKSLASLLRYYLPSADVQSFEYFELEDEIMLEKAAQAVREANVVVPIFHAHEPPLCFRPDTHGSKRWLSYPSVVFNGWHPDNVYVSAAGKWIGPFGVHYNSSIVFYGYMAGLTQVHTLKLFSEDTFDRLGFFDMWAPSKDHMRANFSDAGMSIDGVFDGWVEQGPFMHSVNHPHLMVNKHIAESIVDKIGAEKAPGDPLHFLVDPLLADTVWPVYPEIGERRGVQGGYRFKLDDRVADKAGLFKTLEEMVQASYAEYSKYDRSDLKCDRSIEEYASLLAAPRAAVPSRDPEQDVPRQPSRAHPYKGLPPTNFWNQSFQCGDISEFDPVTNVPFRISQNNRVATAGSCFAQHISARLKASGMNFLITEAGPSERNFGAFSARYGNIYTSRQLIQLFERANGFADLPDCIWEMPNGRLVDAFRPQVEPEGFARRDELIEDRRNHLAASRLAFQKADVFVFTLGLTECWRDKETGAVFPLAPGVVAGGKLAVERCEFANLTVNEVIEDTTGFIDRLRSINPEVKIILTVSPVPLAATYERQHVLAASTYSKSALRTAAEMVAKSRRDVFYFPSYEIITGNYSKGAYFDGTFRNVTPRGVDHVMSMFFRHMVEGGEKLRSERLRSELAGVSKILCDEDQLATVSGRPENAITKVRNLFRR